MNGCHMVAHDWATWHLKTCPNWFHMSKRHWSTYLSSFFHCTYHVSYDPTTVPAMSLWPWHVINTNVPCVTLVVVPHVTIWLVHATANTSLPCHLYNHMTCIVSYHVRTIRTIQSAQLSKFCLFGKKNRSWYMEHTTSIWSRSSCVGFISRRHTHTFVLKPLREILFLGVSEPHQGPGSNSGSTV